MTDLTKIDVDEIVVRLSELNIKIGRLRKYHASIAEMDCEPLIRDRQALREELIRRGSEGSK